jgi:CheY-like chemotaxis protein/signal transduction histidine kinase
MINEINIAQTVLIVDDDENNLQLIAKAIHSAGYRVVLARDGKSALEICESLIPDAILLDIMMPEMSGLEVCMRIRDLPRLSSIPIIFLSAAGEDEMIEQGLISGGSDFISKPFSKRVLLARLRSHIERNILQNTIREKNYELSIRNKLLVESEAYLKSIIRGSPVGLFVLDRNHKVIQWNRAMEEITGISSSDIIGTDMHLSLFYSEKRPCVSDLILDGSGGDIEKFYGKKIKPSMFVEGAYEAIDFFPNYKDGTWFFFTASPVVDNVGTVIGAVESVLDITDQKLNEITLKEIIKKLHLLSGITRHDVLNKVTALNGYLTLIREQLPVTESPEYIDRVGDIVEIIRNLITFTRDYQEIGINSPKWHKLSEIIENVIKSLEVRSVIVDYKPDDKEIYGDPLLERVFYNLFDNSLRHGVNLTHIKITFRYSGEDLVIVYEDNGVGVPDKEKENIFCRKYFINSGFGLFLSREILQITNISIKETGVQGEGVKFEITVPKGHYHN